MKKKVLMILLATMLLLGGCGSKAATNASESAVVDTLAASQAETPSTEASKQENATSGTESKEKATQEAKKESVAASAEAATPAPEKPSTAKDATVSKESTAASTATKEGTAAKDAASKKEAETKQEEKADSKDKAEVAEKAQTTQKEEKSEESKTEETKSQSIQKEESKSEKVEKEEASKPQKTPEPTPESTPAPAQTHSYTQQVISEATCTTGALVANVCSECGASGGTSEAGGALGHDLQRHEDGTPTCSVHANYYVQCSRCGEVTESGVIPSLPCNMVVVSVQEGDCSSPTVTHYACSECGANGGSEYSYSDEHDWVTVPSAPTLDETTGLLVPGPDIEQCSRCGLNK